MIDIDVNLFYIGHTSEMKMKFKKITLMLFLFPVMAALALTPVKKEPFTDLSGEAIAHAINGMNELYNAFFLQREIDDYMAYQREASQENAREELKKESLLIKADFQNLMNQLPHLAFSSLFTEKNIYRVAPPCGLVVTDIYYDEEMIGQTEHPPILDLILTMICESKNQTEPSGTMSFILSVSPEVQKEFDALKFTIIGGLDTELFLPREEFQEYLKEGILHGAKIRVFDSGSRKARWDAPMMSPGKKGIFTIYGELVSPGRLSGP